MLRITLIRCCLFLSFIMIMFSGKTQNYIGLHKDEVKMRVGQEFPGFAFTKEIYNQDRSFIKFENGFEEQTLIFMLNANGFCTSVSRMYNSWMFNRIKEQLVEQYGKCEDLKWACLKEGKAYEVELVKGDWFVTVVTRLKRE